MDKGRRTEKQNIYNNRIVLFLGSICTALSFTMDFEILEAAESGITNNGYRVIYKLLERIQLELSGKGFLLTILSLVFFFFYDCMWRKKNRRPIKYSWILSLFLAVAYMAGEAFSYANDLGILWTSDIRRVKAAIWIFGMYMLYLTLIQLLYDLLQGKYALTIKESRLGHIYSEHPFLWNFGIISAAWLPHILLRYPGVMSYDNWNQLSFYLGYQAYTDAQPIFHTWLFGTVIRIGLWLGSANWGLFLFVLIQSVCMSLVLAQTLVFMKRWSIPSWLYFLTLGIYCIVPYYTGYVSFPIKDYLYTACFVLFVLCIMEWTLEEDVWSQLCYVCRYILSGLFLIMFRNNGLYIYFPVCLILTAVELRRSCDKEKGRTFGWKKYLWILLPLVLSGAIMSLITIRYDVQKNSPKEMLSLPFQQTARYVRDYPDEVTEEERQVIDQVLFFDQIAEAYDEMTADPIKGMYHAQNNAELAAYLKVWWKQFLRHPWCYVEATWNQNYYLFAPNIENVVYNKDCNVGEEIVRDYGILDEVNFEIPAWMNGICTIMASYYALLSRLPIIGIFNNVAFYVILLFVITYFMIKDRCRKGVIILIPLWISFLVILAAPQIQNQPRYAFPIIYSMPLVVFYYMKCIQEN